MTNILFKFLRRVIDMGLILLGLCIICSGVAAWWVLDEPVIIRNIVSIWCIICGLIYTGVAVMLFLHDRS